MNQEKVPPPELPVENKSINSPKMYVKGQSTNMNSGTTTVDNVVRRTGRSSNQGVGRSSSRGVGRSSSRGVGRSSSRGVGRSSSRGVGRSSSRGVGRSYSNSRSISQNKKSRQDTYDMIQKMIKDKKRDRIIERTIKTSMAVQPTPNSELEWKVSTTDGYITGVSRFIIPDVFLKLPSDFSIDTTHDPLGKYSYDNMLRTKTDSYDLVNEPLYLTISMLFKNPTTNINVTIQRQMFKVKSLNEDYSVYEIIGGKKCIPAVRNVTFKITKHNDSEKIALLQPISIIKSHLMKYVKHMKTINNQIVSIPDNPEYNNHCGTMVLNPHTITLFTDISITNDTLV
jgi:hypothetical protein